MQRVISVLALFLCITLLPFAASASWFSDDTLVEIGGNKYTTEDFKRWWKFWQENDQPLPQEPDIYVDWLLLKEEAERMDMASAPGFKRQERIFLQSRGLMLLKNEAVDSQIDVTEEEIETRYQEKYVPRWLVLEMEFADEDAAEVAWQDFNDGSLTIAQLLDRSVEENGPEGYGERWLRPTSVDQAWVDIFQNTQAGKMVDFELHKKGQVLYYLKDKDTGSDKDFAMLREEIKKSLWREEEDQLTAKLIRELMDKYDVEIHEERLAALDLNADEDSFTDEPVITTSKENVSEKQFMLIVGRLVKSRPAAVMAMKDEELAQDFKLETVNNIIIQNVTNWWALDRHFEKEEPFKWSYEFNYNYRMVRMLEQQLFQLKEEPSEEELAQLYQEKVKFYTVPAQAKFYLLDENQGPVDKIWAEVAVGKSFTESAKEHLGRSLRPIETPLNHLDPVVRDVVTGLADGETSQIFKAQGSRVVIHLLSRTPERPLPLKEIKESLVRGYKRESFDKAREAYLEALRSNTKVEVDEGNWKAIQKELGGA